VLDGDSKKSFLEGVKLPITRFGSPPLTPRQALPATITGLLGSALRSTPFVFARGDSRSPRRNSRLWLTVCPGVVRCYCHLRALIN